MSVAMVELPTVAASSPHLKPKRSPSQNPRKGQIFASSYPLFDQSGIPSVDHAPCTDSGPMDRNLNEGIPSVNLASFSPFPPSVPSYAKPSPAAGLSRPRLVKVRKHLASPRVTPVAVPDTGAGPGFSPLRSGPSVSAASDRADAGGTQVLRDQLYTWNPFVPEAGSGVSDSTRPNSGSFESSKSQSYRFVSGDGSLSTSNPNNVGSGEGSGKSGSAGFVFVACSESNSRSEDIGSAKMAGSTFSFACEGSGNSDPTPLVFESGVKKGSNLSRNPSENSSGPKFGNLESFKSENVDFFFSANTSLDSIPKNVGLGSTFGRASSSTCEGSGNSNAGVFVFGSALKKGSNLSQNSSLGSDEGSFSQLPDEMGKLKLQSAGNEDGCKRTTQADHRSKVDENKFIFGGRKNASNVASGNSDAGVFVFGSGVSNSSKLSRKTRNSSLGPGEGSLSYLPDEMRRLKLLTADYEDSFGKMKQADHKANVDGINCIFGGGKTEVNEEIRNSDAGVFVFGSGIKGSTNSSRNTSLYSEEGSFSQLPFEMSKINLQASDESSFSGLPYEMRKLNLHEDAFQKTKQADCRPKMDNKFFTFGGSNDELNSSNSAANKLPEEIKKLNIGSKAASKNQKGESVEFSAGVFGFGSHLKKSSVSCQTSGTSFASQDASTASDFAAQGCRNEDNVHNTKETDCRHKVDVSAGFVFGSSYGVSVSFAGTAQNTLPDDMKKLNIGSKTENSVGSTEQDFLADGLSAVEPAPFKFTFQAGRQDQSSTTGAIPQSQPYEYTRPSPITTPSPRTHFQPVDSDFTFTRMQEGLETPQMEFRTQKQDTPFSSKENLFTGPYQNMKFSMKKEEVKGTRTRKRRGRSRQSAAVAKQFFSMEKNSQENLELKSPGDYSPMDYSPYRENLVADQCSREASVASDEFIHLFSRGSSTDSHKSVSMDGREEELISATRHLGINDGDIEHRELDDDDSSKDHIEKKFAAEFSSADVRNSGLENESLVSKDEVDFDHDSRTTATEPETGSFSLNIDKEAAEGGTLFTFASSLEDRGESNFTFASSPSIQVPLSASTRHYRRKSRMKTSQNSCNPLPNAKFPFASTSSKSLPVASTSAHPEPTQSINGSPFVPQTGDDSRTGKIKNPEANQESITTNMASIAAQEACEKWRLRGNQAYANGHLSKAEDYYTRGVNSVSPNETSRTCILALMLCHSNRAATRMSLGRLREAISDCNIAVGIDPNFLRAQVRAANCHLALGEIEDALKHFNKCLQSDNEVNSHQKILTDASEGLRKAQQVADCMDQSTELLLRRTMNDATKALQTISEALSISPHSESLMEMKAEALLMLRSYEEVIQLCEQTLDSAEKNSIVSSADGKLKDADNSPESLWRWRLLSKSYFYLGKLDEALELLQKHEKVKPVVDKFQNRSRESFTSLSIIIRELLCLKAAGNEAFQAGRHLEAVEHYSTALACNTESRPFAAICFCNRAAAYQALGQITDAIADCTLAVALDASYPKAISRRATLHEMIRDYGQAANDLNRLISLLEKKSKEKNNINGMLARSTSNCCDLNQAQLRLSSVEEEARKATPLDMYIILGIDPSSSAADVKKAYRRAALRHHPDKAGHFLAKNESVDDGLWKDVADEVHMDADRLFKMIGEAYAVLSDPSKRLQYDADEEMRAMVKKGYNGSSIPKPPEDTYSGYERSANRRHWRAYRSSRQGSSEYTRSDYW